MKILSLVVLLGVVMLMSGCATNLYPGGPTPAGALYSNVKSPAPALSIAPDPSAKPAKVGTASATAVLGLVATGDASLEAAMQNAGITKVHHVDHQENSFLLGLWLKSTTYVYGE